MSIKKCIGCLKDVEDKIKSLGIATICDDCIVSLDKLPKGISRESKCQYCGKSTNFIGAFVKNGMVSLYFDCPNPVCAKQRITLSLLPDPGRLYKDGFGAQIAIISYLLSKIITQSWLALDFYCLNHKHISHRHFRRKMYRLGRAVGRAFRRDFKLAAKIIAEHRRQVALSEPTGGRSGLARPVILKQLEDLLEMTQCGQELANIGENDEVHKIEFASDEDLEFGLHEILTNKYPFEMMPYGIFELSATVVAKLKEKGIAFCDLTIKLEGEKLR